MSHENWYNILTDRLLDSVEVNGKNYPVHTSFRDWISFFFLHEDADLTDIEKVTLAMNWYRNTIPGNKAAAYQALQEFAANVCQSPSEKQREYVPLPFFRICMTACICFLTFCDTIKSICRQHRCTGLHLLHYLRDYRRKAARNSGSLIDVSISVASKTRKNGKGFCRFSVQLQFRRSP